MKPKEFDELVRQKFDQNDFAYKSANWDSLAEKLEGRAKKRNVIMWWWVPLAGMAASVAVAMGSTSLLRHSIGTPTGTKTEMAQTKKQVYHTPAENKQAIQELSSHKEITYAAVSDNNKKTGNKHTENVSNWFHVKLNETTVKHTSELPGAFDFLAAKNIVKAKAKKEEVLVNAGYNTFNEEDENVKKVHNVSITLLGGYYQGALNTGYTGGATIRKMLNDKVYIESDIAFASSSNSQSIPYGTYVIGGGSHPSVARHSATRNSNTDASKISGPPKGYEEIKTVEDNYNLYYAQVSPGIGLKIMKRMSIAMGPDFQRMLVDNRPAVSNVDKGNIQVDPLFDVGFIGKSEYAITKRVKAAVSYRKGINNILTPMDKYIDRDYLQFQLRCTIFNK